MKKMAAALCTALCLLSGCTPAYGKQTMLSESREISPSETIYKRYEPLNYKRQTGMWLPYVKFPELIQGKTEEQFRQGMTELLEDAAADNVNTLYFHAHPGGDAYYRSEIYPKGVYLDGSYDPLAIAAEEAHKRNISVHAWLNPLRMQTDDQLRTLPKDFIIRKWADSGAPFVKNVNGRWYLDPSYSETVELLKDTVREIAGNYDIDGIHIDDYFYPTTDEGFDRAEFEASGSPDLTAWRTENVSRFVKAMHDEVKNIDGSLLFGISPQGNISADYNSQYADVRRWGSEKGFCDYIVPQIYFGFNNENSPFLPTLAQWEEITEGCSVSLIIGLAAYKLGREDKWAGTAAELEWINDPDIISRQIEAVLGSTADGYALYY